MKDAPSVTDFDRNEADDKCDNCKYNQMPNAMPEPPPPKEQKLNKRHIVVEILICIFAVISAPTFLGPLILVPVAFAYPIIVSRPKLLFIPTGMASIGFMIMLFLWFHDIVWILLMLFLFAVVSAFGVGAGLLIRRFRISRKRVKVLATTVGIIILLVPFVFVVEMFTGWFRTPFVQLYFRSYVARNYADFDLVVTRPSLHLEMQTFTSQVHDRNNPDLRFNVSLGRGGLRDSFTAGGFWTIQLNSILRPLFEEEFGDEFRNFTSSISGVQVGQSFDLTDNNIRIRSHITIATECSDPETLTEKIMRYHAFIIENGFYFTGHTFIFVHPDYESSIAITIFSPQVINDDLPALIERARNNRNQHGVFQSGDFTYSSRVDFVQARE